MFTAAHKTVPCETVQSETDQEAPAWRIRLLHAALISFALSCALLAVQGAAPAAAEGASPGCFVLAGPSWGAGPAPQTAGMVLRGPGGSQIKTTDYNRPGVVDGTWRLVDTNTNTDGPLCKQATRIDPPAPEATAQWLPSATVEGPGARGPVRLTWAPVVHNGTPASHYELIRWSMVDARSYRRVPVDSVIVDGNATSGDITLGLGALGEGDGVAIRAWWPDGVSASRGVELPEQINVWGADKKPGPRIVDFAYSGNASLESSQRWIGWKTAFDHRGRRADSYQIISLNNHDGTRPTTWTVVGTFAGSDTDAFYRHTSNFLGGTVALRAVWNDGGPAGGPQITESRLDPVASTITASPVTRTEVTPNSVKVSFTTNRCTYGDWRVARGSVAFGSIEFVIDKFNAPRNGTCYTSHGITLGVDTAPLQANSTVPVTVVLTDPRTGEVMAFSFSITTLPAAIQGGVVNVTEGAGTNWMFEGWAIDPTRGPGAKVRIHATVNGQWRRPGRTARLALPPEGEWFGGSWQYRDNFGAIRYRLPVRVPTTGNHMVCIQAIDVDAPRLANGRYAKKNLGCRAVIREPGRPVGEITSVTRNSPTQVTVAGMAFEAAQLTDSDVNTQVVVRVDGKTVRYGVADKSSGQITVPGFTNCWGCRGSFNLAVQVPTGAKRICMAALNPDGRNRWLGCRNL